MLRVGEPVPDFSLPDSGMEMVTLSRFKGKHNVVLFFYHRDGTPSCIAEAAEFSDLEDDFRRCQTMVFGISRDDCIRHAEFRDNQGLAVELLADVDGEVCKRFGVAQDVVKDGVRKQSVTRSTFVIDKKGIVRSALEVTNPKGHAHEVLRLVKDLM